MNAWLARSERPMKRGRSPLSDPLRLIGTIVA
jgi:hypothetical protein